MPWDCGIRIGANEGTNRIEPRDSNRVVCNTHTFDQ